MPLATRSIPRIGDVIEIPTLKGLAYAQYTHKHSIYGSLLRIFSSTFASRPHDFTSLVTQEPQFSTFFPLGTACKRGIFGVVASEQISSALASFPTFRAGVANKQGKIDTWWLWDGEQETKIGTLTPSMMSYPIRGVINDTLLVERIVSGWRHENVI
jgi:hypothetical protein